MANAQEIPWARITVEGAAIVVSILLAFAIDAWWEDRAERQQERAVLVQILRDLTVDADDMRPIVVRSEGIAGAMVWLHNNLERTDVPIDSVIHRISEIPSTYSYEAADAAYAGLKASGSLDLIEDPDLLGDLFFYFEDRQAAMEQLNEWILEGESRFWTRVAPYVRFGPAVTLVDRPPVTHLDLAGMRSDRNFQAEIVWNGGANESQARDGRAFLELNADLVRAVGDYLASLN